MKIRLLFISLLMLTMCSFAQDRPTIGFQELMLSAEENPQQVVNARKTAVQLGLPISIFTKQGRLIEVKTVENGSPVYAVINNIHNPFKDGETMFFEQVEPLFNAELSRINYGNGVIINPTLGFPDENPDLINRTVNFLLVLESSNDRVMLFDYQTGDLVNIDYIPPQDTLNLPKEANLSPRATITISDQNKDAVLDYDTTGALLGLFAPAGGVNTAILDNIRGHAFRPSNNNLVVTVGSGGNANSIAEFDNTGNYVGQFITTGLGGINSPFDIYYRASDVLVTGSSSNAAHRYDHNGNYLDNFVTGQAFPQQMIEFPNSNVAIANFSVGGGVRIYDASGTLVNNFTVITGNRGVHHLGNGNILTSNGGGIHEISGTTGDLVRTVVAGVSGQYITAFDPSIIPVELIGFNATVSNGYITLSWQTATELNNKGFSVERRELKGNSAGKWNSLAFIDGMGTTTNISSYSYTDRSVNSGRYEYRLKQIDFDGTFVYSPSVEADLGMPQNYSLAQNYPNPFNPSTTINFALPVESKVVIKVYNLIGQQVAEVINADLSAGAHSVNFDASGLTSGIYLYTLEAAGTNGESYIKTNKMTLLK